MVKLTSRAEIQAAGLAVLALVTACGGGGGSPERSPASLPASVLTAPVPPPPVPPPPAQPAPVPPAAPTPPTPVQRALSCTVQDAVRRASDINIVPSAGKVTIVAIGSSTTAGFLASRPEASYPSVLQSLLARSSIATFTVINKGVNGDNLGMIEERIQRDLLNFAPQLVILQTGTNDAISAQNAAGLDDFRSRLRALVSRLRPQMSVVLLNGQHFPTQPALYVPFQDVFEQVSAEQNVPLIDRYTLMKSWIDTGTYKFSDILASDSFHQNDFTNRCLAQIASELIVSRTVVQTSNLTPMGRRSS